MQQIGTQLGMQSAGWAATIDASERAAELNRIESNIIYVLAAIFWYLFNNASKTPSTFMQIFK